VTHTLLPAIFGLLGVLVGGLLNHYLSGRSSDVQARRAATAALRLLAEELEEADAILGTDEHRNGPEYRVGKADVEAMLPGLVDLPSAAWSEQKTVLAGTLPYDVWWNVSRAYHWMGSVRRVAADEPQAGTFEDEEFTAEEAADAHLEFLEMLATSAGRYLDKAHESVTPLLVGDRRRFRQLSRHGWHTAGVGPERPLAGPMIARAERLEEARRRLHSRLRERAKRREWERRSR